MFFSAPTVLILTMMTFSNPAVAGERVAVPLGETVTHDGVEISATKVSHKDVYIKRQKGDFDSIVIDVSLRNVGSKGIDVRYKSNKDSRVEDSVHVAHVNFVNATGFKLTGRQFKLDAIDDTYSFTYDRPTDDPCTIETVTNELITRRHFVKGDSVSNSMRIIVPDGAPPKISVELYTR